ncbi:MAG: DUF2270 domain-containing protein [Verrucomicrobiae bacterium]|nr:DUF2270 domain-containing protein [Verrucomicrobiae bacterium]
MADTKRLSTQVFDDQEYFTAMSQFYRGELARTMAWRQRLDATTNWAIIAATGVILFSTGDSKASHIVFLLAHFMILLLLFIEGRRYQYFDVYHSRIRLLETHFLAPAVIKRAEHLEGDWRMLLAEDLLIPSFKISIWEAIGRRFILSFGWIFLILSAAWVSKIIIHVEQANQSLLSFLQAAQNSQPLPPLVFWFLIIALYSILIMLLCRGIRDRAQTKEVQRDSPNQELWRI